MLLRSVLQIQSRAYRDRWIFYVACFGENVCTICGLHTKLSNFFFPNKTLLTLREHLIYV